MTPKQRTFTLFLAGSGLLAAALMLAPKAPAPIPTPIPTPPSPLVFVPPVVPPTPPPVDPPVSVKEDQRPLIQIALLLDNSGSMSGLLEQAKSQLWHLVNQLSEAKKGGQRPRIELALYEYGERPRRLVDFTTELDLVSEALFGLQIRGGDEWCGRTIADALENLRWSKNRDVMKVIFIAGNEPFDQGDLAPSLAVQRARDRGITVNTIYCGDGRSEEASGWKTGAVLAQGRFLTIDHNHQVAEVVAPQDEALARLGVEINTTYIPYGHEGKAGAERQMAQDNNSQGYGLGNFSQRAISKASAVYHNPSWELVDALKDGRVQLGELKEESLPEPMKNMNPEERAGYVKEQAKKRGELQAEIRRLTAERQAFLDQNKQEAGPTSLDVAMLEAVRGLATRHGFELGR